MKLVLAVPTYGPTEPEANRHLRVAIMHAANHGVTWAGDASPNRMKFDASRNASVVSVLESADEGVRSADAILWIDSDVVLPPDAITRLAHAEKDFVCGIYVQRELPHFPLIATYDARGDTFHWLQRWPANVIAPIDGCGFGCVLTSLTMLRAMDAPWFTFEKFSEDFDFCLRARRAGYQLFVDTGVLCTHLRDPKGAGLDDFLAVRDSPTGLVPYTDAPEAVAARERLRQQRSGAA